MFFVVWSVCAKILWFSSANGALQTALGSTGIDLLLRAIKVTVWLGFASLYLRATGRNRPLAYLKLTDDVPKGIAVGVLVGTAFVAKDFVRVLLFGSRLPDLTGLNPESFLSPFVEEVVFRGLVLQRTEVYTGFWSANALTSGLFVAIHLPGWLFGRLPPSAMLSSAAFVFLLSLLLGYLMKRTGSLWACVVCHTMSNWGATF